MQSVPFKAGVPQSECRAALSPGDRLAQPLLDKSTQGRSLTRCDRARLAEQWSGDIQGYLHDQDLRRVTAPLNHAFR
jgi:hypothetical protein